MARERILNAAGGVVWLKRGSAVRKADDRRKPFLEVLTRTSAACASARPTAAAR